MSSKILKTKTENKLICVDWAADEFIVLKHLLEKRGIVGYSIDDLITVDPALTPSLADENDFAPTMFDVLTFSDMADMATFEVYFQKLFDHEFDKKFIDMLKKNGVLE